MTNPSPRMIAGALLVTALMLPAEGSAGEKPSPEPVAVVLFASDVSGQRAPRGHFRLRPLDEDGGEELRVVARAGEPGVRGDAELPRDSRWRVCLDVPGRWAPCENLIAGQPEPTSLRAWPSVTVTGKFLEPPGELPPPERVILRFSAVHPPRREGFHRVNVGCALDELTWSCELPALELDLELRPQGFVPAYRFGVSLPPAGKWDFGKVTLEQGASLVARVATADGEPLGSEAKARLLPFVAGNAETRLRDRLSRPVAEAAVGSNGFVQLAAVPAGVYSLEVTRPGYVPTVESPLELWENKEVRLRDPVVLERPLTLDVVVTPPVDWLDRPWRLSLSRASRLTGTYDDRPFFDGPLDETGRARIPNQSPGAYIVRIIDSLGSPLFSAFDHEIAGAFDAEVQIDLDLLVVRGTLTYQDEPVTATVWFGLRHGGTHSEMAADLEGNFSGVLPNPGWWFVEIDAPEIGVSGYWLRVEVEPDSRGEAEVEIILPDTEVTGRVIDDEGRPVAEAEVMVGTTQWGRETKTDSSGEFRFVVLEPGSAAIGASHRRNDVERSSEVQEIHIDEQQPTPPLELVLRDRKAFQGRVVSDRGPVPGAVVLIATVEPRRAAAQEEARTDIEGRFSVDLPAQSQSLRAIVAPPGHALRAFELPATDSMELAVPASGGSVALQLDSSSDSYSAHDFESWTLFQDGLGLSRRHLLHWTRGHGMAWKEEAGELTIPQLAPGHYRLCRLSKDRSFGWQDPTPIACDEGFLSSGGYLELELPRASD